MVHRLKKFAKDTGEYFMRPVKNFKKTPQYTYLSNIGIGFWIFLIVTFCLGFLFAFYIESFVGVVVSVYGLIGIFFLTILLEMIVQPVGPDLALILGVLAGFNGWIVLLVVLIGAYLALYLSYLIGKKIGTPGIERIIGKKTFEKINWTSGGKWFMLIGAATPVPYIPYLTGSWNFSLKDTILYVAIPRTVRLMIILILTHYFGVGLLNLGIGS
jgi:membrane protein YqaA with SNARE-associated domain